jgi:hypothetical protein
MTTRLSISDTPDGLLIIVPRRFELYFALFFPLWTAGWIAVAIYHPPRDLSSEVGIAFFSLITILFLVGWLWNWNGREELLFTPTTLTYRRVLFGLSRTRVFELAGISDSRFVGAVSRGRRSTPSGLGFSYGGKRFRVCDKITLAEAKELASAVLRRFPEHAPLWSSYQRTFLSASTG